VSLNFIYIKFKDFMLHEGSDCLIKTQDIAKFNNDVKCLIPARCCKVKRRDYKIFRI
jgi:hypothetical protein